MTLIRLILLLMSLGFITTSGTSYFSESESEEGAICCENSGECANAGGMCCDFSDLGVEPCGMGAPGYCRTSCVLIE